MGQSDRLNEITQLLGDKCVQTILKETSQEPMSAAELNEACTASRATVYRRLDELTDCDLLVEQTKPDPEGHHHTVYAATLDRVMIDFVDGEFEVTVMTQQRAADRFTNFIEGLYNE
ncbi:winged helix-turn-helix domain-containing protein [Halorubrum sp. AJ67]|uniref:winged helix-turn-helix domain-containing protein n=1 Tax=Halorubrum sp. AJ67 TaxID=1173487 RepID=UPI0003DD6EC1|nr:winged helix-turn-helix domain-containing protein [Halorubrum sp. AJ67]CDK39155.1 arsR family transcriptional regulator protein [Halorubrum sp. AJ67]